MDNNNQATLQLGTKPVGRLLWQYALPAIIAMTAASLYNMVDSIFIGQGVGPMAISGLTITFPLMNLTAAFGAAIGVGASTAISVKLGQKDYAVAQHILGNTVTLNLIVGLAVGFICLLFLDPILLFFGASEQTLPYARDYMVVILAFNVFSHMFYGMNSVLRASGKPRHAMYATVFTVVLNAILDPIFIWPLGLGIRGAAYATILSQALALVWQMWLFSNKRELLHLKRGTFRPNGRIVGNIIAIGLSPFLMNVCACIVVIFINNGMVRYGGDLAVGAYGIANKVAFIFVMICMGVNQGMQPIAGYNFGARHFDRLIGVLRLALMAGTAITLTGFMVGTFFPTQCVSLFAKDSPELIGMASHALTCLVMMFPIVGIQIVSTSFFQSIGSAKKSIFLSLTRQLIFLVPAILILPHVFSDPLEGLWHAAPLADALASVLAIVMLVSQVRKFKLRMAGDAEAAQ